MSKGDRRDIHKNARLTPQSRAELVRWVLAEGQPPKAVATAFGVSVKTGDNGLSAPGQGLTVCPFLVGAHG